MAKVRLTRTMIMEYEPNPEWYPKGSTIGEMAQFDIDNANETGDYETLFNGELICDKITSEIID